MVGCILILDKKGGEIPKYSTWVDITLLGVLILLFHSLRLELKPISSAHLSTHMVVHLLNHSLREDYLSHFMPTSSTSLRYLTAT